MHHEIRALIQIMINVKLSNEWMDPLGFTYVMGTVEIL